MKLCRTRRQFGLLASLLPLALVAGLALPAGAQVPPNGAAGANRFDLTGPRVDVHVQRGDKSLPIALVPNLLPGDKVTIHADLPQTQSVHLLLVIAFLRGSTNPPPPDWFTAVKTWEKNVSREGVTVTVPDEAQQALFFLAPETGGDYSTLKSAVTGRPGVFVRAAQDLNEASFEQARIERYLQLIRQVPAGNSDELADHSKKLAATLNLKPNDTCFKQQPDQQLACLRQTGTQLLLDDGHGQTLAAILSSGDSANLIGAAAATPMANAGGAGMYSAYVGTIIDLVHLMAGLHTAQFQYIPAIAFPDDEALNLRLNTPPSFHNPRSVIVVALPTIKPSVAPPLRLQDAGHVSCLLQPSMVLPLEGAPLVFATAFAHDLMLHLNNGTLNGITDIPLVPNAFEGGLMVSLDKPDRKPLPVAAPEARDSPDNPTGVSADVANKNQADTANAVATHIESAHDDGAGSIMTTGTLRGMWGFDSFQGVTVPLQRRSGSGWGVDGHAPLLAGKANELSLHAEGTACASEIDLDLPGDNDRKLEWKQAGADPNRPDAPHSLHVKLPLEKANPGDVELLVHQYGTDAVAKVAITAYSDATRLQALHIHAGDNFGTLTGSGLSNVQLVRIEGVEYKRIPDQPVGEKELRLVGPATPKDAKGKGPLTTAGETGNADVVLNDGRTLPVNYTVDGARPAVTLLSKSAKPEQTTGLPLNLTGKNDLPLNARITFALKSNSPARFPRGEKVEVALADGSLHATLAITDGSLVLQDAHTALGFFSPAKSFGPSAFGPLQIRAVGEDGTAGDWIPVGTLVRTPSITGIVCARSTHAGATAAPADGAAAPASGCQISGNDLFLVDEVAGDSSFNNPEEVPLGFAGDSIPVPHPADNRTVFVKLRDDPDAVFTVTSPTPLSVGPRKVASVQEAAPAAPAPGATTPAQ